MARRMDHDFDGYAQLVGARKGYVDAYRARNYGHPRAALDWRRSKATISSETVAGYRPRIFCHPGRVAYPAALSLSITPVGVSPTSWAMFSTVTPARYALTIRLKRASRAAARAALT